MSSLNRIVEIDFAIKEIKKGKIIIVVDDSDRENEGDFVASAELITKEMVNFVITKGKGILCQALDTETAKRLNLEPMVKDNNSLHYTNFTVSVDANACISTGVSAKDREITIKTIANKNSREYDLLRPGHIFPLIAKKGGVLERNGHTEAVVDLMKIAGLSPTGILCEVIKDNGEMARIDDLQKMAEKYDLYIIEIKKLIEYIKSNNIKL